MSWYISHFQSLLYLLLQIEGVLYTRGLHHLVPPLKVVPSEEFKEDIKCTILIWRCFTVTLHRHQWLCKAQGDRKKSSPPRAAECVCDFIYDSASTSEPTLQWSHLAVTTHTSQCTQYMNIEKYDVVIIQKGMMLSDSGYIVSRRK